MRWRIYIVDNVIRLTNAPAPDGLLAVSTDGSQLAFIGKRGGA
ncbi:MAG: hypothetical protein ACK47M_00600 [Caldilinea sp.]